MVPCSTTWQQERVAEELALLVDRKRKSGPGIGQGYTPKDPPQ
jgi:hypothetical protein